MRILRYIPLFLLLTLWSCQDEFPIKGTVGSMEELTPSKYKLYPNMSLMAHSGEAHELGMQASITHNTSWIITGLPSWLTITPSQGSGEGTTFVTISFAENTTGDVRSCKFYLKSNDGKVSVPIEASQFPTSSSQSSDISNLCPDNNHPHQIDLGLSVKWTCCNVGASSPADYGGYYAWGETATKGNYEWETYKWCNGRYDTMSKYCTDSELGTVDNLTQLEMSDDAARVYMGSPYRIPTIEELTELNDNCTWTWVTINNINGYKVTASNGNSIFLPVAGERSGNGSGMTDDGIYMSSSLYTSTPFQARILSFSNNFHITTGREYRYYGMSVRAVVGGSADPDPLGLCPDNNHPHQIDLGLNVKWACCNVGATSPIQYGSYYAWGETSEKTNYTWTTYKWCNGTSNTLTRYCTDASYGTVDTRTTLLTADDAATANLGTGWRTPSQTEWTQIRSKCTWTWTTKSGVAGCLVTGTNGNSIFLPAAGSRVESGEIDLGSKGNYWVNSLSYSPETAEIVEFDADGKRSEVCGRIDGHTVRAVAK
ncbi:MAG: BACON domain-containing protein [Bacteroidaceae bacterium]|nr:BACON domain-containing protein [Bacteroidaceae bacterium]